MSLEDYFFTVSEMKDGLTASSRVKELVDAMLAERDSVLKNVGIVASTIAATEDKDCLDLFVELNGVLFINKWLEEAQKAGCEPSDSSAEESITALLRSVEKLRINYEQSVAYGIRSTVEKLLNHSSVRVQEKARALFDSWNQLVITSEGSQTIPSVIGAAGEEKDVKTGDDVAPDKVDDMDIGKDDEDKGLLHGNIKEEGFVVKKPFEESVCNKGELVPRHLEGDGDNSTLAAAVPKEDGVISNQFIKNGELINEDNSSINVEEKELEPPLRGSDLQTNTSIEVDNKLSEPATGDTSADMSLSLKDNNSSINVDETPQNLGGDCDTNNLKVCENGDKKMLLESSENSSSRGGCSESISESEETDFFKAIKGDYDDVNKKSDDFDLGYGLDDALEIARQVANEVEREVEDQIDETSPTVSQKTIASVHVDEAQIDECASKQEFSNDQNDPNVDSSQIENKPDKGIIEFDLNQDICFDDTDQPIDTLSVPVSIVSASRATSAPGFRESPLKFEGARGWKGSAATSAFRPASPRKIHDSDKIDKNNLNNRRNCLDFDLNMSEEEEIIKSADLLSQKQIFHFGESSGEAKLDLDLNRVSDEGDALLSDWRPRERLLLRGGNGHYNASPSTSSSSMQQPLRNFDLNDDQPSFFNDSQKSHSFLGPVSGNNVISIMGTKVEVNQKKPFLQNDRVLEPALDVNMTRSGGIFGIGSAVPYPHPGMFTYNGLTTGPTGPFSPVMYGPGGPIPYMVDSRGASVVPQFLGSQTPFAASGIYGPGPSRPNFEYNLGLIGDRVNKESGGLRQFLGPGPNQSFDELRSNFHPMSSIGLGKRKEPDGGWGPYPFDYKRQYPRWR